MDNQFNEPVAQGSQKTGTIISTILITAIIIGGGVWWWQKSAFEKEKETLQQQIEELKNQISETIDTSDWKTYRNEEYGFEIKIPDYWPDFNVKKNVFDNSARIDFYFKTNCANCITENGYMELLGIMIVDKDQYNEKFYPDLEIFKQNSEYVFFKSSVQDTSQDLMSVFEESEMFFSTFKFIDIGQSDQIDNLEVYKNTEYGFEFKYPSEWVIDEDTLESDVIELHLLIMPDGHPVNKAGYLDLIKMPFNVFEEQYKAVLQNTGEDNIQESDFNIGNILGKYYIVMHKNGAQIDYVYDFSFDGETTMRINFNSYLQNQEKIIGSILQNTINDFVKTIKKID